MKNDALTSIDLAIVKALVSAILRELRTEHPVQDVVEEPVDRVAEGDPDRRDAAQDAPTSHAAIERTV
jgi:hypothetical protein